MAFQYTHTVRFNEVDKAGVIFFSRYFEICHNAWEEALGAALGNWFEFMEQAGWGLPLAHAEADFRRPAFLGDGLHVALAIAARGESSLTLSFEAKHPERGLCARVQHVHTSIGLQTFRPVPLAADFLGALAEIGLQAPG